tara:strand:+ start:553 stop:1077 length:525 start_codon:yes stop_codon:yes gene_type:complete
MLNIKNKRGQVATGMTWVIATIVIIFILGGTIFVVGFKISPNKKVVSSDRIDDLLVTKSFFSYLKTIDGGRTIFSALQVEKEFNERLAGKIFKDFYSQEYDKVWVGVLPIVSIIPFTEGYSAPENDEFGKLEYPVKSRGGFLAPEFQITLYKPHIIKTIKLSDDHGVRLLFLIK